MVSPIQVERDDGALTFNHDRADASDTAARFILLSAPRVLLSRAIALFNHSPTADFVVLVWIPLAPSLLRRISAGALFPS